MHFASIPLHLTELVPLIDHLLKSSHDPLGLILEHIFLVSGTWADALDLLREIHIPNNTVQLLRPRGVEDRATHSISHRGGKVWKVFNNHDITGISEAEQYVHRELDENPFRAAIKSRMENAETEEDSEEEEW